LSQKENVIRALPRKIIASAITGPVYVLLLALVTPYFYESNVHSPWQYVEMILVTTLGYMLYSFPVILLYGSLTSIVSDLLSSKLSENGSVKLECFLSLLFHLIFGLLILWISLPAALLYFLIDRYLRKRKRQYKWSETYKSFIIPIGLFLLFILILVVVDFTMNWKDYIVF
jgi:hypothetical protein